MVYRDFSCIESTKESNLILRLFMNTKILAFSTTILLAACGGSSAPTTTPNTGIFLDSKVEGLDYSTDSLNGKTNANGEFQYEDGESITFSLYEQTLSVVPAYSVLTPFDNPDDTIHVNYTINLLRFLQTLDTDGDPTNGITLPTVTGTMNINFNQNSLDFESDSNVINFIIANTNVSALSVSAIAAIDHFSTTLANVTDSYTLDLAGKTATSVMTPSYCTNGTTGGFTYSFTSTGFSFTGSDSFTSSDPNTPPITCALGASSTEEMLWKDIASDASFSIFCGPSCTYTELNRVSSGVDFDGRNHITSVWHVPNSSVITEVKRVTSGTLFNFIGEYSSKEITTIQ